jgi:hypothetical protein
MPVPTVLASQRTGAAGTGLFIEMNVFINSIFEIVKLE